MCYFALTRAFISLSLYTTKLEQRRTGFKEGWEKFSSATIHMIDMKKICDPLLYGLEMFAIVDPSCSRHDLL